MRIAFFDSGFGGLSVLDVARREHPAHHYLYYADSLHAPYGAKPASVVRALVFAATDIIAAQQPDALVIACNTATAVCVEALRARYSFPVIGMEPAVKPALDQHEQKRVLVMATSLTLQESKLSELLQRVDRNRRTDKLAMDTLVEFAEQGHFHSPSVRKYVHQQLRQLNLDDYASVVLGCTHFVYFEPLLQAVFGPGTNFVNGNEGTVRHLFSQLAPLARAQPVESTSQQADSVAQPTPTLHNIAFFRSGVATPVTELEPYFKQLARVSATKRPGTVS